ncbi:MAG: hypothetical protein WKF37_05390 [Bryobacteraceae bacterium]
MDILKEQIPDCDAVIIAFYAEAITCYKAGALLACAFTPGAASEKAMNLLFETFGNRIQDQTKKKKYQSKLKALRIAGPI